MFMTWICISIFFQSGSGIQVRIKWILSTDFMCLSEVEAKLKTSIFFVLFLKAGFQALRINCALNWSTNLG